MAIRGETTGTDEILRDARFHAAALEAVARLNPDIGEVENIEALFFSTRLLRNELFELPVNADVCSSNISFKPRPLSR